MRKISAFLIFSTFLITDAVAQTKASLSFPTISRKLFWENTPLHYEINKGSIVIEAGAKTDMFRDPNATYNTDNAPKLLFSADSNFILITSIKHSFASKWDGGAIVLKSDSAHWIKFCFEKDYTGARRVVSVVTNDVSDDCNSVSIPADNVYYKMAKAGNVITLYYSIDNRSWLLVRHLQIDFQQPIFVGFLAQSPTGEHCRVMFSEINYQIKR